MKKDILIAGVGNILLQDEGVGVHFVNSLKGELPECDIQNIGNLSLSILAELQERDCIVLVDALNQSYPGEYAFFEITKTNIPQRLSFHDTGIDELITVLRLVGGTPAKVFVFGIKPHSIDSKMELSSTLTKKLPYLKEVFKGILAKNDLVN